METPIDPYVMTKNAPMLQALYATPPVSYPGNVSDPIIVDPIILPPERPPSVMFIGTSTTPVQESKPKLLTPRNILIGTVVICAIVIIAKK